MAERPLLAMPRPETRKPKRTGFPREKIPAAEIDQQAKRIGPRFDRLERAIGHPETLTDLRDDPSAIIPERALVFELASSVVDFYRAIRSLPTLEFLGEDEGDAEPDDIFFERDEDNRPLSHRRVPRRLYFTMPDRAALEELVSLWNRYRRGESTESGFAAWRDVFGHLVDIRPWGREDRMTEETISDFKETLEAYPDSPIRLEVEFWYRRDPRRQNDVENAFSAKLREMGGTPVNRASIEAIWYHAALVSLPSAAMRDLIDRPEFGLAAIDDVMSLRPQSLVEGPVDGALDDLAEVGIATEQAPLDESNEPIVALLDGMPLAQHDCLSDRLVIDDPDNFGDEYRSAADQRHGTAMASLILHGDLNGPESDPPVTGKLYVRPVMYPQYDPFDGATEAMPLDDLGIDLIWRAFIRMFEGEGGDEPTAPTVCAVNFSLGNPKRRFAGVMSPWARLIDYLSWRYNVLIIVSAGNIQDHLELIGVGNWMDFENASASDRQAIMIRSILRRRADRRLLSPSEAINSLTVGAAHCDHVQQSGSIPLSVNPYENPFLPNMSSALGTGFRRSVKPEILVPGGAEHISASSNIAPIEVRPTAPPGRNFGIGVARPDPAGQTNRRANMSGTSVATALATHNSLRILEMLGELPNEPPHPRVDDPNFHAVILKALVVHSSCWDSGTAAALKAVANEQTDLHWEHERDEIGRFLGFGCPRFERVIDCAKNRATMLGWNIVGSKETHQFAVPLPSGLGGLSGFRALTVTIAWTTPITPGHRAYRLAKIEAGPGGDGKFSIGVKNAQHQPSHNAVGRGSVYHRRWEGGDAAEFVDGGNLLLDVTCRPTAGALDDKIRYAVVATLEVGQDVAVDVYNDIRAQIADAIGVRA